MISVKRLRKDPEMKLRMESVIDDLPDWNFGIPQQPNLLDEVCIKAAKVVLKQFAKDWRVPNVTLLDLEPLHADGQHHHSLIIDIAVFWETYHISLRDVLMQFHCEDYDEPQARQIYAAELRQIADEIEGVANSSSSQPHDADTEPPQPSGSPVS